MTRSTFSVALRIALLLEEHSERELREAVSLIKMRGGRSCLLDYLAEADKKDSPNDNVRPAKKRADVLQSKVVSALETDQPEKFRILVEFEKMVRDGRILSSFENLKRFGESISKDFVARKSRKDSISPLIALIAERPIEEIEKLLSYAASLGPIGAPDQYQRLARYLIKGKEPVE